MLKPFIGALVLLLLSACTTSTAPEVAPESVVETTPGSAQKSLQTAAASEETRMVAKLKEGYRRNPESSTILFWTDEERRYGFKNADQINFTRAISAGNSPLVLGSNPTDLTEVTYTIEGSEFALADFVSNSANIGLLVVQDGKVLYERYAPGNNRNSRWISFSVTKSLTSMLIGAAIKDGYINSVDDKVVDYLPRLRGSAYEEASIADVLHMASGVAWDETYADRNSDVAKAGGFNGIDLMNYLADLPNEAQPGTKFNYNSAETNLVGEILRSAIGNNAATYLTHKIWQPFGMESDANWALGGPGAGELGGCCISATLRDYARVGLFALADGQLADGTRVLPEGWMAQSIAPSQGYAGYGYLWWLWGDGAYSARGIFGQQILVDPKNDLVIALHSNAPAAVDTPYHQHIEAALAAIRRHLAK